jgi:competence protein CoiA
LSNPNKSNTCGAALPSFDQIHTLHFCPMLSAVCSDTLQKHLARDAERGLGPFHCPQCEKEVILRKGRIKIHHFAHKPPVSCVRGKGESEAHYAAKLAIYDALCVAESVSEVELEKDFGMSVADVYAVIGNKKVAIEIQRSNLNVREINMRTRNYFKLGVAVLWLGLPSDDLDRLEYSPRAWEKWCHAAYFGRVYFWEAGETIRVVHFDPHYDYVPATTWRERLTQKTGGDYYKASKRLRTPVTGERVALSQDFVASARAAWEGGSVNVPRCALFMDTQARWWK